MLLDPIVPVFGLGQRFQYSCNVLRPACFHREINSCVPKVHAVPLTLSLGLDVHAMIEKIEALCRRVGVPPRLADLGVRHDQNPANVKSSRGQSMSGNPRDISDAELTRLLEKLL